MRRLKKPRGAPGRMFLETQREKQAGIRANSAPQMTNEETKRAEEAIYKIGRGSTDGGMPWQDLSVEEQNAVIKFAEKTLRLEESGLVEAFRRMLRWGNSKHPTRHGSVCRVCVELEAGQDALKKYQGAGE